MSTQPSWDKTRLRLENARLRADLRNVREEAEPYDAGGDAVCRNCDMTLGAYEDFVSAWSFCPYCGCKLTWGAYWTGEFAC